MTQTTLTTAQQTAELITQLPPEDQKSVLKFTEFLLAQHQQPLAKDESVPTIGEMLQELAEINEKEPFEFEETVRISRPNPLLDEE
ncbi:MAG: hypothetical protein ACFB9N_09010 [Geitlerinemataceae cyanobacterium]